MGCTIEVGPVSHGVLDARLFQETEMLVLKILAYIDAFNRNDGAFTLSSHLTIYQYIEAIDYPRNQQGELIAMIHPDLQFNDYTDLNFGDPMFLTFNNEIIYYTGDSTVNPVFINEAAYYEKGIAMCLS